LAKRDCGLANSVDVCFGIASGGKGLTALTVMSLIEEDPLGLTTTARSGIGDHLDEGPDQDINDHVLPVAERTVHDPDRRQPHMVLANTSHRAWPITRQLDQLLDI
jgi:CubicO group peptidase (beta-lactamase class C family)